MTDVLVVKTPDEAGEWVASRFTATIATRPDAVFGLATGSTPLPIYRALARQAAEQKLDLSRVRGFALDEYVGLPEGHEQSYRTVITNEVVKTVGLNPELVHVPNGAIDGIRTAGERYEEAIVAAGGIDWQILGVGSNGHIGFNEPGSSLASLTRVVKLAEQTRQDNARFFDSIDDVPTHSITQGVGTILRARNLVLLAFGEHKAAAVASAIEGPVTASVPASAIQLHPHVTVLADEAAASQLRNLAYYRSATENKPEWLS
ncbi:glucosamine-6-phosphate deaminase [Lysinibacter cavernae]|uniref:Glucosamine-6-phosphate deaminase n=1 Tax=Lysinibacter cavernae TaxID=1640652 RepID=A0A7X5R1F3_9MICO|nr:glucosamine-6-phosphate deaminase [Lysinibacter cavernae]NIH53836.1 glucosamine-6-phosphate deaminase [Lysinibacter cavernae]